MKKIAAILLALILIVSVSATAFADGFSITVENIPEDTGISINGKTFRAYKLFDVTSSGTGDNKVYAYSIKEDNPFYVNETVRKIIKEYFTLQSTTVKDFYNVIPNDSIDASISDFTRAVNPYLSEINVTAIVSGSDEEAVFTGLEAGYYIVAGEGLEADGKNVVVGALALNTLEKDVTINMKAGAPMLDEVIRNSGDSEWYKGVTADVGSIVDIKITSSIPATTGYPSYDFTIVDTLSSGLTPVLAQNKADGQVALTVKVGGSTLDTAKYTASLDGQKLTVNLLGVTGMEAGHSVEIVFSATVNDKALTTQSETSTATLTFSSNPYDANAHGTITKKVYVYDFDVVIDKYVFNKQNETDTSKKLDGVKFVLYKEVNGAKKYYKVTDSLVSWVDSVDQATEVETKDGGVAAFTGVAAGTYKLSETFAPRGYNKLEEDAEVVITYKLASDGTMESTDAQSTSGGQYKVTKSIANSTGAVLPSTGGMGTTVFYIGGSLLVLAAVVLLITKRRMAYEKD